jgi:hypothetical protein
MSKRNPTVFPDPEREADVKPGACPPGKELTDALREASQRNAAAAYRQIFTDESRSRQNG